MKLLNVILAGAAVLALGIGAAVAEAPRVSASGGAPAAPPTASSPTKIALPLAPHGAVIQTALPGEVSGTVSIYRATQEPERFVIFVSGDGGWNQGVVDMARQLARMDATVVGMNIRAYLHAAQAGGGSTIYPAGDLANLAQSIQKKLGFQRYHRPVLVGYSSGATLVYGALAQAPADTFQGAIALGFCADLKTDKPLASAGGRLSHTSNPRLGFIYAPSKALGAPFIALQGGKDETCLPAATHSFVRQTPRSSVIDLPNVGHGYSVPANWAPQFAQAFASLYPAEHPALALRPGIPTDPRLAALPLTALPAVGGGDTLSVFYSGDGGWAGIDQGMSAGFVRSGIPVVGYDSLRYFWTARTPENAAADLTAVLRHYMAAWGKSRIMLTGYSFGANALPAIVPHLPPDLRARIRLVALVGVAGVGELEFRPLDWLNLGGGAAYRIEPALNQLRGIPMVCVYGDQEINPVCPTLSTKTIRSIRLSGGHHYNGDFEAVSRAILQALPA